MPRCSLAVGVLADDLTGALASAARLHDGGLRPVVQWREEPVPATASAVVADMRTRDYGTNPRLRARTWAAHLRALGCARIELRTDSTLRGEPAAELAGALAAYAGEDPWVLAVPAFPEAGRAVVDGRLVLDGVEAPTGEGDVARVLFPGAEVAHLPVPSTVSGEAAVAGAVREAAGRGVRRFVADATAEEHLRLLAAAARLLAAGGATLLTVSPGAWLRYACPDRTATPFVLVVVSSATRTNHQQLAELRRRRPTTVVHARDLLAGETGLDWDRVRSGETTVVVETISAPARDAAEAWLLSMVAARAAGYLLDDGLDHGCACAGVVVGGGQTASALMDALGASRLDAGGEVAPLCPRARLRGGPWAGLRIVTKGGLVGHADTLTGLVDALWKETL